MPLTTEERRARARFWSKVDKDGPVPSHVPHLGPCWVWTAGKFNNGCGCFRVGKRMVQSHRYSYEIHCGEIPRGHYVLHKCDRPCCVNPSHLFTGTQQDNMDDMVSKGRQATGERVGARGDRHGTHTRPESRATGDRNGTRTHPESVLRGEQIGFAKLTEELVRMIRRRYVPRCPINGCTALAHELNVSLTIISLAVHYKTWKHVT